MNLIFPIAALKALCFVTVATKVLITHQCFGYCWAVLHSISNVSPTFSHSYPPLGWIFGGHIASTADPKWPKWYSIPYDACSTNKRYDKKEVVGVVGMGTSVYRVRRWVCYLHCLLPEQPISVLKPCFSGSDWSLLMGSRKYKIFCFLWFLMHDLYFSYFKLPLFWSRRGFSVLFSLPLSV